MVLLDFVLNTAFFAFRNTIYQHKFSTAMGIPVSSSAASWKRGHHNIYHTLPNTGEMLYWWHPGYDKDRNDTTLDKKIF